MTERRSIHVDDDNVDTDDATQRANAPGSQPLVGRLLAGKYLVRELIGKGAMGAVYRARQVALDKRVAIKVMNPVLGVDGNFAQRFKREAKAASRLEHPNSVHILDFGQEPDGTLYMAMEFLEGVDLGQLIERSDFLPDQFVVDVVAQALSALSRAHELGIIHRDLKPENIMILDAEDDEGRRVVKVCDFGIAKLAPGRGSSRSMSQAPATSSSTRPPRVGTTTLNGEQDETAVTKVGHVLGTPEYMSPEQGRGQPLDLRSDIYSMGVILYQMLTKALPFDAETPLGIVAKHVIETPRAPSAIRPKVNRRLEAVAMRAMQKTPEARYATAREMRADLRAAMGIPDASGGASGRWSSKALVGDLKADLEGSTQAVASSRDLRPASPDALSHASTQLVVASPPKGFAPAGTGAARTSARTRTAVIAVAGVAVISLALVALGSRSRDTGDQPAPSTGSSAPTAASAPPAAVPVGVPSAAASAETPKATVSISASPAEAKIFVDDAPLANPGSVTMPRDGKEHAIRVEAAGYVTKARSFTANASESSLSFDLEHATAPAPSAAAPKRDAPVAPPPDPARDPSP